MVNSGGPHIVRTRGPHARGIRRTSSFHRRRVRGRSAQGGPPANQSAIILRNLMGGVLLKLRYVDVGLAGAHADGVLPENGPVRIQ